jgi:hypothetical protein
MALFLIRTFDTLGHDGEVPGEPQGFTDIGDQSVEAQKAINSLKELSVTLGTSLTTYEPDGLLSRSQMGLFLTRLVRASGVTLPDGSDQGFTDIGDQSLKTQEAINQMKQLGITAGATPTTYNPSGTVTRAQMASFLARTLNATISLRSVTWDNVSNCDTAEPKTCTSSATYSASVPFTTRTWWGQQPPPATPDFWTTSTRAELTVDGQPTAVAETTATLIGIDYKYFAATFPTGLTAGSHIFEWRWYTNDALAQTHANTVSFSP